MLKVIFCSCHAAIGPSLSRKWNGPHARDKGSQDSVSVAHARVCVRACMHTHVPIPGPLLLTCTDHICTWRMCARIYHLHSPHLHSPHLHLGDVCWNISPACTAPAPARAGCAWEYFTCTDHTCTWGMCAGMCHLYRPHMEGIHTNVIKQPNEKSVYTYFSHLTREIRAINIWKEI